MSKGVSLLPHQHTNAVKLARAIKNFGGALDASATGTGKTLTALATAGALDCVPFVVCPKPVGPSWEMKGADVNVDVPWLNYEKARMDKGRRLLNAVEKVEAETGRRALLIWDEAHRVKSPSSLQAESTRVVGAWPQLMLSATPFSSPLETRALLNATGVVDWVIWYQWLSRNTSCYRAKWFKGKPWMWDEAIEDIGLLKQLLSDRMVATHWSDMENFPDRTIECVPIELSPQKRKLVDEYRNSLPDDLGSHTKERVELERLRVPPMAEMAHDTLADGAKVLAFFNYTEPLLEFAQATNCPVIHGETSDEDRQTIRREFTESKEPRVLAVNGATSCEGLDYHDTIGVPVVSLVSPPYTPITLIQEIGRTHRHGGVSPANIKIIFVNGTMESERILPKVAARKHNIETLTTGDLNG